MSHSRGFDGPLKVDNIFLLFPLPFFSKGAVRTFLESRAPVKGQMKRRISRALSNGGIRVLACVYFSGELFCYRSRNLFVCKDFFPHFLGHVIAEI